ncbi:hypothetical protein PF003_g428 [Phytophthora fragariae]|nr:hypothetical protein PF003_g428 [Phytophthora fragariae]
MASNRAEAFEASVKQRWGFLDPWWKTLAQHIEYCPILRLGALWGSHLFVLNVTMPVRRESDGRTRDEATFRKEFQQVREALALLIAVEHADPKAYAYLLRKYWKIEPRHFGDKPYETTHVALELDVGEQEPQTDEGFVKYDLVRFCGIQSPSEEYVTALSQIVALAKTLKVTPTDIEIPVKVMYGRYGDDESGATSREFAKDLMDIAQAEKEIEAQWETMGGFEMMDLTQAVAGTLESLLDDGFRFSASLMVTSIRRENPDHELEARKALGQFLRQLLSSTRRKQDDAHIPYDFDQDEQDFIDHDLQLVLPGTMRASDFEAMCSAMLHTQTTENLLVATKQWDEANNEHKWKWLAYALFSKRARSSIQNLVICAKQPTAAEARAFTSILTSEHPEEALFGTPRGVAEERDATLRSGAPLRWEFDSEGQPVLDSRLLTLEAPIPLVRTFSDDGESEWINVLVPGFGRCQVQRSNLDFASDVDVDNSTSCIISLVISAPDPDADNLLHAEWLLPCIELIGFALTSLTLDGTRIDENAIIRCCPNLQELSLTTDFLHVQLDFSDYRASRTPTPHLSFAWLDIVKFVNDLVDRENPLSRCVRRLRVDLATWGMRVNGGVTNEVTALLKMLSVNERLGYLEVVSPLLEFTKDFSNFHRKPIFQQREPLSMKCMLAFLSVLPSRATSTKQAKKRNVAETTAAAATAQKLTQVDGGRANKTED